MTTILSTVVFGLTAPYAGCRSRVRTQGAPCICWGVAQDITNRKLAELALAESRGRLEEAQNLAKLGNWEANLSTGELYWSEEIYRIFGQDSTCFLPSVAAFQQAVHPDDIALVQESERRAAETGIHDIVHRIVRPDGGVRYVHELAKAFCDKNNRVLRLSGTVQDVTELKRAEQAMMEAKDVAVAASRSKSEFLASMSHELRTPLNAVLGFSQLIAMERPLPQDARDNAGEIERAGQHLLARVNDLIDLARIEAGKLKLALDSVPVASVLNDSLAMMAPIAAKHGIELIHQECGGDDSRVIADYVRLHQVIIHLLSNAIKYNRPAGSVRLSCHVNEGNVRISIRDTGPGSAMEKQGRVFTSFDRLGAERGSVEGTGIGLVITRNIVEAMGGSIGLESVEGQGSHFWEEFPASPPVDNLVPLKAAEAEAADAKQPLVYCRVVLYIEDNPMNLRLMQRIFAKSKYLELRDARTAGIGIELARAAPPALILLDINLPGKNGAFLFCQPVLQPRGRFMPAILQACCT